MRQSRMAATAVVALLIISACSSSPSATQAPGEATQAPGGATQAPGGPTQAPGEATQAPGEATQAPGEATQAPGKSTQAPAGGVGLTGHECDAVPTFSASNPGPSFSPDTDLEGHFPPEIDGNPVTNVNSLQWVEMICMFGGQAALQESATGFGNLPLGQMSFGSADASVDGDDISLSAFRTPGQNAGGVVQYLSTLAAMGNAGMSISGSVNQTNISGKDVYVFTDTDGAKSYAVPLGDTLVFFDSATDDEAAKIIAALQ